MSGRPRGDRGDQRAVRAEQADLTSSTSPTSSNVGSFDFGDSVTSRRPVVDEFIERFPATIELAVAAMFFSILVGIPLGFVAAKRYGGSLDHFSLVASLLGISIPIFVLAIILKYIFAVRLGLAARPWVGSAS